MTAAAVKLEHVEPPPIAAATATHARLAGVVDKIRREFAGDLPDSLARVLTIYVELGQAPGADVEALETCMHVAVENTLELARLGAASPPGLVKDLEVIDLH
jgi:hypothetical protein